jgi:hypothetical protein
MSILDINFESKSVFLPSLTLQFYKSIIDIELVNKLNNFILSKRENILKNTQLPVGKNPGTLTARLGYHNLFDFPDPEIQELKLFIQKQYTDFMKSINHPGRVIVSLVECGYRIY